MVTLGTRLRNVAQGTGGIALAALMIGLALLMIVAGSFALEAWTGWPDIVTIMIMVVLAFFVPQVGGIIGLIGLFYLPW